MQPIATKRLLLRPLTDEDTQAFITLNQDPIVMQHFPAVLSAQESIRLLERLMLHHREHGFGILAVEAPGLAPFLGCVGVSTVTFDAPFTPNVELAWRLAPNYWGHGFATEAAAALVNFAFATLRLPEVVAFTAVRNVRSIRVMERLAMRYVGEFDHPKVPEGHTLRRHVLYRLLAKQRDR